MLLRVKISTTNKRFNLIAVQTTNNNMNSQKLDSLHSKSPAPSPDPDIDDGSSKRQATR